MTVDGDSTGSDPGILETSRKLNFRIFSPRAVLEHLSSLFELKLIRKMTRPIFRILERQAAQEYAPSSRVARGPLVKLKGNGCTHGAAWFQGARYPVTLRTFAEVWAAR